MNAHFETDGIYPLSVEPAAGWGKENTTDEYVLSYVPKLGKYVKETGDAKFALVTRDQATRYPGPAEAALAAGALKKEAAATAVA